MESKPALENIADAKNIEQARKVIYASRSNLQLANEQILIFNKRMEAVATQAARFQHLASLAKHHPDPQLKISEKGTVLISNEAANRLFHVTYEGQHYNAADWWKFLALKLSDLEQIEVIIDTNIGSFLLSGYHLPDENNYNVYCRDLNIGVQSKSLSSTSAVPAEKQHASGLLPASSGLLKAVIDNLLDGFLIEDEQRKIVQINEQFCKLFNIPESPAELVGTDSVTLLKRAMHIFWDGESFIQNAEDVFNAKARSFNIEHTLHDGRIFSKDYLPIYNDGALFMGSIWVFRDATDGISANESLEKQRSFYETILNNLPTDIFVLDPDHRYRFVNPVAVRNPELRKWIIGKTEDEYSIYQNIPVEVVAERHKRFREVLEEKKEIRWEEETIDKYGIEHVYLRSLYPVVNTFGNVLQIIGYGIEITERKYIEQQVKLSEKRYRELIQYSQGIIITHDLKGVIKSINPAVQTILEIPAEEVLGKNIIHFLPETERNDFHEIYLSGIQEQGSVEGVVRVYNASGKKIYFLYKNVIVKEAGVEPYVIGFAQDVTERILAEKELEVARQVTEESSKAKERFLANMSHEIRTPMNGILGISNLLKKTKLTSEQENYLNMVLESANNLIVIINDILDLEKIVAGKLEFESISFNLTEKLHIVSESFRFKAEEKDLILKVENRLPKDLYVVGDPYRLSQILNNIISNAIKFTEQGSITVWVSMQEQPDEMVEITYRITDTGIGISPDKLSAIFDPYVQERSEISRKYGGTGLGLAICKNLVEMQHGMLEVNSVPGEGSSFLISIPYKKAKEKPVVVEEKTDYKLLEGKKILIAEDVEINQFLVKHILQGWNCIVTIVPNGEEALEAVINDDFDVLLMDIQMPVMNGIEATQNIRNLSDKAKASIPIIALTANALKGDDVKYKSAGMNGYITKPFNELSLYSTLVQTFTHKNEIDDTKSSVMLSLETETKVPALYNLSLLETMSGGDPNFVPMLVKLFIDTTSTIDAELEKALENKDWKMVGNLAHKLKPTIDNMGVVSLKQVVREVEYQGKTGVETDWLESRTRFIMDTINTCREKLKAEFNLS